MESCTFTKTIHNFSAILSSFPLYLQQKHIHCLSLHIVMCSSRLEMDNKSGLSVHNGVKTTEKQLQIRSVLADA
jgi:hypothetical protein